MEVRLMTFMESRIRGNMYVRFGGGFLETCYSNIVRRWVSILRLKAQYIWYLAVGLLSLLLLFSVVYILGINVYLGLVIIGGLGTALVMKVYAMSAKYGEHGLLKKMAMRQVPKLIKCNSRKVYRELGRSGKKTTR